MRKVVVSEFLALNGIMSDPAWTFPYWNDEIAKYKDDESKASDALLLGRITYEGFAQAWPESKDEGAERMNSMPKFVASRTLDTAEWNASIIKGDLAEEINKLKEQGDGDLLVYGSGNFVETLIKLGLVDEYHLLVYPVVVGEGKSFFKEGTNTGLKLVNTQTFSSGVVALTYQTTEPTPAQ